MQKQPKKLLAAINDLFFTVKVRDAAKKAGMMVEFVKDGQELLEKAEARPSLIVFDLNFDGIQPLELIGRLKSNQALKHISLIGYLSHVQGELKLQAQEAGCDMVLARSAFSQNLPSILKRHAGTY